MENLEIPLRMKVAWNAEPPHGDPWGKALEQEIELHSDKLQRYFWMLVIAA